jgi:aryl-alcohol dehydrogenase (NADP+)
MKYVQLGRSGLTVSAICLGGNSWGAAGRRGWAPIDQEGARPFFRAALDAGVNFFDTANVYNAGESERIIGATLLRDVPRDEVVISTKVGIPTAERPNAGGVGRKHLMLAVDASLKRLGTDHIDLLQLHRIDAVTPVEETMAALNDMVRAGKVLYIGGSTMPAWRFAQMCTLAAERGWARPVAMQNLYNLVQREEEREMIPLCLDQGVGLVPYSPLARGFLGGNRTREGATTQRARTDRLADGLFRDSDFAVLDAVLEIASSRGVKAMQVALAWLLSKAVMAAPVVGVSDPAQIADAAAATALTLTAEEIARLEAGYEARLVA